MKIILSKNIHNTCDAVLYGVSDDVIHWFQMIDVWCSKGYDRYNDGGIYFEIPRCFYESNIFSELRFVSDYGIKIVRN